MQVQRQGLGVDRAQGWDTGSAMFLNGLNALLWAAGCTHTALFIRLLYVNIQQRKRICQVVCIKRKFNHTRARTETWKRNTWALFPLKGSQSWVHKQTDTHTPINTHTSTTNMHLSEAGMCLSKTIMGWDERCERGCRQGSYLSKVTQRAKVNTGLTVSSTITLTSKQTYTNTLT